MLQFGRSVADGSEALRTIFAEIRSEVERCGTFNRSHFQNGLWGSNGALSTSRRQAARVVSAQLTGVFANGSVGRNRSTPDLSAILK
jgi:hypothetical protein